MKDGMTQLAKQVNRKQKQPHPAKYYQAWQYGVVVAEGSWALCAHKTKDMKGVYILGVR